MNKRIKELANKAGYSKDYLEIGLPSNMEKFAELIVRECAEMVRIQNEQFIENESHYGVVSTDILKHFGLDQ